MGIEGIHWEPSEAKIHGYMYSVFSSESNMMTPVTKHMNVTGEDRYFVWNTPVLLAQPGTINSNYIYWQFIGRRISTMTPAAPAAYVGPRFRRALTAGGTFLDGTIQFFSFEFTFIVMGVPVTAALSSEGMPTLSSFGLF